MYIHDTGGDSRTETAVERIRMLIRKATEKDIPEIAGLYDEIISLEEAGETTTGWLRGVYPTYETAEAGVGRGDMFLQEDGHGNITGAAVINQIQVDCYADGKWEYPAKDSEVMVIHTLVISGSCLEKGYGSQFLSFYEDYAKERGCWSLRLDTNAVNEAARSFYKKHGYKEIGIVPTVFNGIPDVDLVLLEKKLIR